MDRTPDRATGAVEHRRADDLAGDPDRIHATPPADPPAPPVRPPMLGFPEDPGPPSPLLSAWVAVQAGFAVLLLASVVVTTGLRAQIGLDALGLDANGRLALGIGYWIAFGLIGGLRARERPGGSVMTFSMPFIVAGTVLGGPLAGGILGIFSELEVRELRHQPWYGTLSNHAVAVIAAICGATAGHLAGGLAHDLGLGVQPSLFAETLATAVGFAGVNIVLVIPTLALRYDVTIDEASKAFDPNFRMTTLIEAVLAWLMAMTWLVVGWWGPVACAILVLLLWDFVDNAEGLRRDPMTGLLNSRGYQPALADAIAAARVGRRASVLLYLDLDGFKDVNDVYLTASGDEVIRTVASRLLRSVRATDTVGRSHVAGDEFIVLLSGVPDAGVAEALARRLQARISQPIPLRSVPASVSVGASIGLVYLPRRGPILPGTDASWTVDEVVALAEARLQEAKVIRGSIVATGEGAIERRRARERRRSEAPGVPEA